MRSRTENLERRVVEVLQRLSPLVLRVSLGTVFVWFGALKVAGDTPVGGLVARTLPWIDPALLVPALGAMEVALGIALLAGRFLRPVLVVLAGHLTGTFLVLVSQSEIAFRGGNPLLLTVVGEFVVKNVVLVAAVLVLASQLHPSRTRTRTA